MREWRKRISRKFGLYPLSREMMAIGDSVGEGLIEGLRKGSDNMSDTLSEMPKVGDKVRCLVSENESRITSGCVYEVLGIDSDGDAFVLDDTQHQWFVSYKGMLYNTYGILTDDSQPDVHDLIANLGRRLHEVEQYLADEEAEQYSDDDDVVTELTLEPGVRDAVNHPNHYTTGAVEVIDYIDQVADGYEGKQAVYAGNIIKYVSRAPYKNQAEDIRKAIWYAQRLADAMEREEAEAVE